MKRRHTGGFGFQEKLNVYVDNDYETDEENYFRGRKEHVPKVQRKHGTRTILGNYFDRHFWTVMRFQFQQSQF